MKTRVIVGGILVLFLVLRVPILFKDLAVEEGTFIKTGVAILEEGKPEIYIDELRPSIVNFDKPPFTRVLVALGYKMTGDALFGARLVPFIFAILQFFLLLYLIGEFYDGKKKKIVLYGSLLFYSLLPLAIHVAGEIQIDYIVSFFLAVYVFSVFSLVHGKKSMLGSYLVLFASIFFSFASKYEPALMAVFLVNVYMVLKRIGFKKLFFINAVSLAGISAYLGVFYLYVVLAFGDSFYFSQPVSVIEGVLKGFFMKKLEATGVGILDRFKTNFLLLKSFVNYVSLPALFLFLGAVVSRRIKDDFVFFNFVVVAIFTLIYLVVGWSGLGFPRYFAPTIISLSFLVSLNFSNILSFIRANRLFSVILAVCALLLYVLWFSEDRVFFFFNNVNLLLVLLVLLGVGFLSVKFLRSRYVYHAVSFVFVLYFLLFSLFHIQHDVFSNKIVTASYGQEGVSEVVELLHSKLDPSEDLILANDNIGFCYGDKYYFWNIIWPYKDRLEKYLSDYLYETKAFVISEDQINQYPEIAEYIEKQGMEKYVVGTFVVYL